MLEAPAVRPDGAARRNVPGQGGPDGAVVEVPQEERADPVRPREVVPVPAEELRALDPPAAIEPDLLVDEVPGGEVELPVDFGGTVLRGR